MSGSPKDYGPRRVFDGQGWGTVLTLALSSGWSWGGNGLIGLVADVQPPTATAGLRWGLQGAVLQRQGHLGFHSQPSSSHGRPNMAPVWCNGEGEELSLPFLPLLPPHCQSRVPWNVPSGSPYVEGK